MNKLLFAVTALILLYATFLRSAGTALAGGPTYDVSPHVGEQGTTVVISSTVWKPGAPVKIYAAFVRSLDERPPDEDFAGPLASAVADSEGTWRVELQVRSSDILNIPNTPGFVLFRAVSLGAPAYLTDNQLAIFAVTSNGERPNGAGEIRLTVTLAPTAPRDRILVSWAWRRADSGPFFVIGAPEGTEFPFTTSIEGLPDGDWQVTALGNFDLVPVGEGPIEVVQAPLCTNPDCTGAPTTSYAVRTVSVWDGGVTDVRLILGDREDDAALPPTTGQGYTKADPAGSLLVIVGALIGAGTVFLLAGCAVRRIVRS
jgi:hypothetical protein